MTTQLQSTFPTSHPSVGRVVPVAVHENAMEKKHVKAMFDRLHRIESRVVRGFEEMGVEVVDPADWFRVEVEHRIVHLKGTGKSIRAIQLALADTPGCLGEVPEWFDVCVDGRLIAKVIM